MVKVKLTFFKSPNCADHYKFNHSFFKGNGPLLEDIRRRKVWRDTLRRRLKGACWYLIHRHRLPFDLWGGYSPWRRRPWRGLTWRGDLEGETLKGRPWRGDLVRGDLERGDLVGGDLAGKDWKQLGSQVVFWPWCQIPLRCLFDLFYWAAALQLNANLGQQEQIDFLLFVWG